MAMQLLSDLRNKKIRIRDHRKWNMVAVIQKYVSKNQFRYAEHDKLFELGWALRFKSRRGPHLCATFQRT